jgi:exopolyphosphatase / guanosine-5'-triphosphate,3'-diphosphate pyrophosphatase
MENKLAIIDLGTNTFHLMIAEYRHGRYSIVYRERSAVKIGVGGINRDIIQEDGIMRAIAALQNFKSIIDQHQIKKVFAFGTSALRNASNAPDVVKRVKQSTGIDITIISGDKEAELIYKGVRSAIDLGDQASLIIDIGGGSVEFIIANRQSIYWKRSFEIGGQRLLEKFQQHDPIAKDEIQNLNNYFQQSLPELFQAMDTFKPVAFVGSSGTFDTLSEIFCAQEKIPYRENDPETPLTLPSFYSTYQQLISKNRAERLLIPGMIDMRVDMIVVACCLIRYLLEKHSFTEIRVSTFALKEGVLAELSEK